MLLMFLDVADDKVFPLVSETSYLKQIIFVYLIIFSYLKIVFRTHKSLTSPS